MPCGTGCSLPQEQPAPALGILAVTTSLTWVVLNEASTFRTPPRLWAPGLAGGCPGPERGPALCCRLEKHRIWFTTSPPPGSGQREPRAGPGPALSPFFLFPHILPAAGCLPPVPLPLLLPRRDLHPGRKAGRGPGRSGLTLRLGCKPWLLAPLWEGLGTVRVVASIWGQPEPPPMPTPGAEARQ